MVEGELLANMDPVKPWRCAQCHAVLGVVERDGDGFRRLRVLRRAVADGLPVGEGETAATVRGGLLDVHCDLRGGAHVGAGGGGVAGIGGENRLTLRGIWVEWLRVGKLFTDLNNRAYLQYFMPGIISYTVKLQRIRSLYI
jgi:hypothetical protein